MKFLFIVSKDRRTFANFSHLSIFVLLNKRMSFFINKYVDRDIVLHSNVALKTSVNEHKHLFLWKTMIIIEQKEAKKSLQVIY